jgi:hypothetical protein
MKFIQYVFAVVQTWNSALAEYFSQIVEGDGEIIIIMVWKPIFNRRNTVV